MTRSNPDWRHRRRLIYGTYGLCFGMIAFAMATYRTDTTVAREMTVGAVSLLAIILTAYTAFATVDDHWQRTDREPSDFDSQDRGADGDGVDC